MRSRFAAFALGRGAYLYETLAESHPDRDTPCATAVRELSRARERQRFLRLAILWAAEDEVLFHAGIFERGEDRSFAELSSFVRENGRWRYASGLLVPASRLPADLARIEREAFLMLV